MTRQLRQRVIIVTGASSGIGAATALACAQAGMDVVVTARRVDRLEEVADQIRAMGRRAVALAGDVADPDLSSRLLDAAEEELGRVDAVFANAGYMLQGPVIELTDDELREIFEINVFAAVTLLRQTARRLVDRGRPGHLLMCSSCVSKFSLPLYAAYSATKAAQNSICSAMRLELADRGIHVSSVHPISTSTELFDVAQHRSGETTEPDSPGHTMPMFTQTPQRVARAIVGCLRRPVPEVWTSHTVRFAAGLFTVAPRFADMMLARQMREEMRHAAAQTSEVTRAPG